MPRFGIPFLVIAILAGCIAINTIQFPVVREMLSPGDRGSSPLIGGSSAKSSQSDFDSRIPEPIAPIESPVVSTARIPPASPNRLATVSGAPSMGVSRVVPGTPVVAEVARPVASDRGGFADSNEVIVSEPAEELPIRSRGSWDTPSTLDDDPNGPFGSRSAVEGSGTADHDDSSPNVSSAAGHSGGATSYEGTARLAEEPRNVYIPPPAKDQGTAVGIDWPAEAAPSGRYAQRSTESAIVHSDPAAFLEKTPAMEPASPGQIASTGPLVPIRRPSETVKGNRPELVSASGSATKPGGETATVPQYERLPAVK